MPRKKTAKRTSARPVRKTRWWEPDALIMEAWPGGGLYPQPGAAIRSGFAGQKRRPRSELVHSPIKLLAEDVWDSMPQDLQRPGMLYIRVALDNAAVRDVRRDSIPAEVFAGLE